MPRAILAAGDPVPHFTLPTPHGVEVSLRECLLRGTTIIEFVRGTWDPNACARLKQLSAWYQAGERKTWRLLVVTGERRIGARRYLDENPAPFSLLIDEGHLVARAFGVFRRFSFGAWNVARPATFVVDACGYIRWVHVGRTPIDASPLESLLRSLENLANESTRGRPSEA